jgi:hypothetical protein
MMEAITETSKVNACRIQLRREFVLDDTQGLIA